MLTSLVGRIPRPGLRGSARGRAALLIGSLDHSASAKVYLGLHRYSLSYEGHGIQQGQEQVMVGYAKAVYVREQDTALWERAEAYAAKRRMTVSAVVLSALEAYLNDVEDS